MNRYDVITKYYKNLIRTKKLKAGDKLPSIRNVSLSFACSKNTAIRAFIALEREHLIYAVPKSGYYVVDRPDVSTAASQEIIDFASVTPHPSVLPYQDFQHCLDRAITLYQQELFTYTEPQGFYSLRCEMEKQLATKQIFTKPDYINVVAGSQQAIYILAAMPFPNGKMNILVEQPTYSGVLRAIQLLGATAIGIRRTAAGIDFEELERYFRGNQIKFFYTVPRFHNPLGTSYAQEEKKKIALLAKKYDVYIVEDDYLADLERNPKADSIFSADHGEYTIYLKSFSKVMLPGLRLGIAVLPSRLQSIFNHYKKGIDIQTTAVSQAALEVYLQSDMYEQHIKQLRKHYHEKMKVLQATCDQYLPPSVDRFIPDTGIFAHFTLPDGINLSSLQARMRQDGIHFPTSNSFYLPHFPKENYIRLCVMQVEESEIKQSIAHLGAVISDNRIIHWVKGER
ncbi:PLP-dependent aminotransferase family protein [Hazenella sp. IB182357]|uniref:PLP-dependent aminotransferase family protein n=1 Tax=Polycladospora coralii TaxID=2771432 RepID=A0A926N5M7_9BACL|nr:PLP-dependent aminotransferase family protein [Polycladospora coralii]MBD1371929.1 PLP-dependent aminotransferase family protein [Polycladospora coralii]